MDKWEGVCPGIHVVSQSCDVIFLASTAHYETFSVLVDWGVQNAAITLAFHVIKCPRDTWMDYKLVRTKKRASEVCPVLQQLMELFLADLESNPYRVCVRQTFTCLLFLTLLNTDMFFQKEKETEKVTSTIDSYLLEDVNPLPEDELSSSHHLESS
ncbi:hypothetical protein STEG23_032758 [Scotinomys teguina]